MTDNGKMPEFTFNIKAIENMTPRQMDKLYRGVDLVGMAPLLAQLVTKCSKDIGPLDNPDTYLDNLKMAEWNSLISQLGDAIKNG